MAEPPDRRAVKDRSIPWDHPDRIGRWNPEAVHINAMMNPIAISPTTRQLAAAVGATPQNEIQILNYETGAVTRIRYRNGYYRVSSPTFSPDGRLLAFIAAPPSWGGESEIILFDVEAGEMVRTYGGPGEYFDQIRFTRSGDALHVAAIERTRAIPQPGPPYQSYREIQREQLGLMPLSTGVIEPVIPFTSGSIRILAETETGEMWLWLSSLNFLEADAGFSLDQPEFCDALSNDWSFTSCMGSYYWTGSELIPVAPQQDQPRAIAALPNGRILSRQQREPFDTGPLPIVVCDAPDFAEDIKCDPPGLEQPIFLGANPTPDALQRALVGGIPTIDRDDPNDRGRGVRVFEDLNDLTSMINLIWPDPCGAAEFDTAANPDCVTIVLEPTD